MKWFQRHLAAKLLLLTFLIAVVPYAAILIYSHLSEERLYTEHFLKEHHEQMLQISGGIDAHFAQLYRELSFLSGSVVMEDMLVNDLDRRIASLLDRYKSVYDIDINLLALSLSGRVVASTRESQAGNPYKYYNEFETGVGSPFPIMAGRNLMLLEVPVRSVLGQDRIIGYLVMEYRLKNLERFNLESRLATTVLFSPETGRFVGSTVPDFQVSGQEGTHESEDAIWLYQKLVKTLPGWYLGYRVDRAQQLSAMRGLTGFLLLMLIFGMAAIAVAAYWFSKRIVAPLDILQQHASEMVRTQRYDLPVAVNTSDEIGQLAKSFNALAEDVQNAFEALQKENIFRLERLTQMIVLFNRLMQTEEESECLKSALGQLKTIAPEYNVRFSRYGGEQNMPSLYVYDFDHDILKYYGSLIIPEDLAEEEEAFFRAIASMIAARIEQIRTFRQMHRDAAAKTAFISHLSHDLRTPLHAILSQTQFLIGYGKLSGSDLERIGSIENAAQQLLGMINDLLDLARLDSGKYEPELETLAGPEVTEILEEVGMLLSPLAEQKHIALRVSKRVVEGSVVADRRFLRQIVLNLVSNAIKFTDRGSVSCRLERTDSTLCILVQDTGRGMTSVALKKVFEPFVQSEGGDSAGGSGLGLALSRRYAQQFGAELMLFSDGEGRGTVARLCFTTL